MADDKRFSGLLPELDPAEFETPDGKLPGLMALGALGQVAESEGDTYVVFQKISGLGELAVKESLERMLTMSPGDEIIDVAFLLTSEDIEGFHEHENLETLDGITDEHVSDFHGHDNLETLDQITDEDVSDFHGHTNLEVLEGIGSDEVTAWNAAVATVAGVLLKDGSVEMTGNLDLGGNSIVDVADPVNADEAATAGWVLGNFLLAALLPNATITAHHHHAWEEKFLQLITGALNPWAATLSGSGSRGIMPASAQAWLLDPNTHGVARVASGAGTALTDFATIYHSNQTCVWGVGATAYLRVGMNALAGGLWRVGFSAATVETAGDPDDGVYLELDPGTTSQIQVCCSAGGSDTKTASGFTPTATSGSTNGLFWVRMQMLAADEIEFRFAATREQVDIATAIVVDSNVPTSTALAQRPFLQVASNGTAHRELYIDTAVWLPAAGAYLVSP